MDDPIAKMHPELKTVFSHFAEDDVAIVGSAVRDFKEAGDIDVLVKSSVDVPKLAEKLGATYNGWDLADGSHVRRINLRIPGVSKKVQIVQNRLVHEFGEWPHAVLQRDGSMLNADKHFTKDKRDATYVGYARRAQQPAKQKMKDIYRNY